MTAPTLSERLREYGATLDFAEQERERELMSIAAAELERLKRAQIDNGLRRRAGVTVPREPIIEIHGPVAFHDQRCCILPGESAVYYFNDGVFYPSWRAQADGWRLVRAKTRFGRWVLSLFGEQP